MTRMDAAVATTLEWHTELRVINDLIPNPNNPRFMTEGQVAALKESLTKFNLVELPVVNTDNQILAGHQRLKVLQSLGRGIEEIEVRVPNRPLTREEADEYLIRSNKNTGEWDLDLLTQHFAAPDLLAFGFQDWELPRFPSNVTDATTDALNAMSADAPSAYAEDAKTTEIVPVNKNMATCPKCGEVFHVSGTRDMAYGRAQYYTP